MTLPNRASLLRTRLGELDKLAIEILSDLFVDLEDRWMDQFEELIDHTDLHIDSDDEAEAEKAMDLYDVEMEKLEIKVMRRVGKALINWSHQQPDRIASQAQELAFGKRDDGPPDNDEGFVEGDSSRELRALREDALRDGYAQRMEPTSAPLQADPEPPFLPLPEF